MITLAQFRSRFPEFADAGDSLVNEFLTAAANQIGPVFGAGEDDAHGWLTAALLVKAPNGKFARLRSDKGTSTYQQEWERALQRATVGLRVF